MERLLGQSIVIENVPGAAGGIVMSRVLQAEPRGHITVTRERNLKFDS